MKALTLSILTLILTGLSISVNAQVTAIMQAKVEIISGAGFTTFEDVFIDLNSENLNTEIKAGSFSLVSAPGTDVNIHIKQNALIKNQQGEFIEFESLRADKLSHLSGRHDISVNGKLKNGNSLDGHYQGSITAVVEYL